VAELAVERLTKHFDGVQALTDVTLSVGRGEIVGLIGPNGSGKTTLLNVVTGVHRPTSGRVRLADRDITGWPPHRVARAGIARTFQSIRLFADLMVSENVMVSASTARDRGDAPSDRTARVLRDMELTSVGTFTAGTLSYGDQRRLDVARALALEPDFVLLDEPAAGLNREESQILLERIQRVRDARGCGVMVVDHDMRMIMRLCDRIHVLDAGRSLFEGTPAEVRSSPAVAEAYLGDVGRPGA
jgi:ABC-type branched-subunit amino acid transport system ATPase component